MAQKELNKSEFNMNRSLLFANIITLPGKAFFLFDNDITIVYFSSGFINVCRLELDAVSDL